MKVESPPESIFEIHQEQYISNLKKIYSDASFHEFRYMRHKLDWATNSHPDIVAGVNILSKDTAFNYFFKRLNQIYFLIAHLYETLYIHLNYIKLNNRRLRLVVFCDGYFGKNEDQSSKFGYLPVMDDNHDHSNFIHYSSTKTKRIFRTVLGTETISMSNSIDMEISLSHSFDGIMGYPFPIHVLTDSKTLFDFMIKSSTTTCVS